MKPVSLRASRSEYYQLLRGVTERGEWEQWVLYMIRGVEETSILTLQKIDDINKAKKHSPYPDECFYHFNHHVVTLVAVWV
jgi:Fic family protein